MTASQCRQPSLGKRPARALNADAQDYSNKNDLHRGAMLTQRLAPMRHMNLEVRLYTSTTRLPHWARQSQPQDFNLFLAPSSHKSKGRYSCPMSGLANPLARCIVVTKVGPNRQAPCSRVRDPRPCRNRRYPCTIDGPPGKNCTSGPLTHNTLFVSPGPITKTSESECGR